MLRRPFFLMKVVPRLSSLFLVLSPSRLAAFSSASSPSDQTTCSSSTTLMATTSTTTSTPWIVGDDQQAQQAKEKLQIWPLDEHNAALLNQVHPQGYIKSEEAPHDVYDLIALGAGAGGLVSSKQSARRGAKRFVWLITAFVFWMFLVVFPTRRVCSDRRICSFCCSFSLFHDFLRWKWWWFACLGTPTKYKTQCHD